MANKDLKMHISTSLPQNCHFKEDKA